MAHSLFGHLRRLLGAVGLVGLSAAAAGAAETKSYVVDWFYMANYYGGPEDCPKGLNPSSVEFYRRDFTRMGKPKEDVDRLLDGFPGPGVGPWSPVAIIRGDGKSNVYENPSTAPDPGNLTIEGKYAWGFNLDGRGANEKSFEDPDTHEAGIDNELYRTVGCIRSYRPSAPGARSVYSEYVWDVLRDRMPAWLITVEREGDDAKVIFDRALQTAPRDATGEHPRVNMTFEADPSSRAHLEVKAKVVGDTLVTEPVTQINFMGDDFGLASDLSLRGARMKFKMNADGSLKGLVGGYQRWVHVYFAVASRGFSNEYVHSQDAPSVWYALKRGADANPDPKTGENRDISAAYMIEALPAKVIRPPAKAKPQLAKRAVIDAPLTTPAGITLQMTFKKQARRDASDEEKKAAAKLPPMPPMVYADARGMSLYTYDKDAAGVATCTGDCAKAWPPVLAAKDAKAFGDWTLIKREDGSRQWAVRGKPLYANAQDTEIGQAKGVGTAEWKAAAFVPGEGAVTPQAIKAEEVVGAGGIALVNSLGMPLYVFDGDALTDKTSCAASGAGVCLNRFSPVLAGQLSRPIGDFTVIEAGQRSQWAYKGKPLFSFDGDTQPGDAVGAGIDRRWQVALVSRYFMPANVIVQRNHYEGFNLTTTDGMTIYQRDRWRSYNGGHSVRIGIKGHPSLGRILGTAACVANCLDNWKPLVPSAKAQASGWWEIAVREDGTRQWVYQGYPVYTFNEDRNPGDMKGNEMLEYVGAYANVPDPFSVAETGDIFAGPGAVGGMSGTAAPAMVWHSVLP